MQDRDKITYSDEEVRRVYEEGMAQRKRGKGMPKWELHRGDDLDFIKAVAKTLGWLDTPQRVQIRRSPEIRLHGEPKDFWVIEPYEEDCDCPNIVPVEFDSEPVT